MYNTRWHLRVAGLIVLLAGMLVASSLSAGENTGMGGMQGMQGMAGTQSALDGPPVDSEQEATEAAAAWLGAMGGSGFRPDKVQDIGEIFVVDVMAGEGDAVLRDQLVIRKFDGFIFSVFPFGVPGTDLIANTSSAE
ncbi:MAG TPA: hypothetical protein QF901_08200 [Gammaproteobacteria bacterium]|jgi:hypothetical protein|nr:hypothetical protein [Gammaproteobacteria bacterium]